jgi:hypothetical protein
MMIPCVIAVIPSCPARVLSVQGWMESGYWHYAYGDMSSLVSYKHGHLFGDSCHKLLVGLGCDVTVQYAGGYDSRVLHRLLGRAVRDCRATTVTPVCHTILHSSRNKFVNKMRPCGKLARNLLTKQFVNRMVVNARYPD